MCDNKMCPWKAFEESNKDFEFPHLDVESLMKPSEEKIREAIASLASLIHPATKSFVSGPQRQQP